METERDCAENGKITNRDMALAQIEMASKDSQATFDMLRDILTKFFPTLFYLNGGAAIAVLAFIGEIVNYNDKYLLGIVYALGCFAVGAFLTALALGASYFSQSYFQEISNIACGRALLVQPIMQLTEGQMKLLAKGKKYKCWAIIISMFSGAAFLLGCIVFCCTLTGIG